MTAWSARLGLAIRPAMTVTRSWLKYRPSTLPTGYAWVEVRDLIGAPLGPKTAALRKAALSTRLTWGRRANSFTGNGPGMTSKSEGLVLARKVGNDDSVRRAPATAPMAKPPNRPIKRTRLR